MSAILDHLNSFGAIVMALWGVITTTISVIQAVYLRKSSNIEKKIDLIFEQINDIRANSISKEQCDEHRKLLKLAIENKLLDHTIKCKKRKSVDDEQDK